MKVWHYVLAGMVMVGACGLAYSMRPTPSVDVRQVSLERQIPRNFGAWREQQSAMVQVDLAPRNDEGQQQVGLEWPYDQTLTRVYRRADGEAVMFALAWGSKQRQEIKVHRPELCYASQGFQVVGQSQAALRLNDETVVPATRLITKGQGRAELVTYWIRIGDKISQTAWQSRLQILGTGLRGTIPDGILVRVSQSHPIQMPNYEQSYAVQAAFVKELLAHLDESTAKLLVGSKAVR